MLSSPGIVPRYLLVSRELEDQATAICSATWPTVDLGADALDGTRNVIVPVIVPHWTSATQWYVVGDPMTVPLLELGFTAGSEDPSVIVARDETAAAASFNADKVIIRITHSYAGAPLDFRGFARGNS